MTKRIIKVLALVICMCIAFSGCSSVSTLLSGSNESIKFKIEDGEAIVTGVPNKSTVTKIVIPANIATFINSLKVNIGLSLVGVISGEFLVSKAGLGYLIVYGGQVFQLDLVMASVVILGIVAAVMYEAVVLLEKLILKTKKFG